MTRWRRIFGWPRPEVGEILMVRGGIGLNNMETRFLHKYDLRSDSIKCNQLEKKIIIN